MRNRRFWERERTQACGWDWRLPGRLLISLVLLAACTATNGTSTTEASNLTLDELPIGLGRGYLVAGLDQGDRNAADAQPGNLAPNFRLQTEDGRHLSLHDLQGQPVLINFWATWCGPCRLEMPTLVKAAAANPQLVVLAVNVQEDLEQIQPFAEEFQMTMPIVRDTDGELRQQYAVKGMPTTVFIDKEGRVAVVWAGLLTEELFQKFLTAVE